MKIVKYISLVALIFIGLGFKTAQAQEKPGARGIHYLSTKLPRMPRRTWFVYRRSNY